jgi:hypothetical protein
VSRETMEKVDRLVREFLIDHALQFYEEMNRKEGGERIRTTASYILTSRQTEFKPSDFTRNVALLKNMGLFDLVRAVSPLVAGGWLDLFDVNKSAPRWRLCKGVAEAMAERRHSEEREKAALAQLMGSRRRPQA